MTLIPGAVVEVVPTLIHVEGKPLGRFRLTNPRQVCRMIENPKTLDGVKTVAWQPNVEDALNQGSLGSCVGNATAQCLSTAPFKGKLTEADAVKIYSKATQDDSFPGAYPPSDTGSTGAFGWQAAKELGYFNGGFEYATGLYGALKALQTRSGTTGNDWYDTFDETDSSGRVKLTKSSVIRGGHEFLVLGVDVEKKLIWFRNSWGPDYGVTYLGCTGCFCMSWSDYGTLLQSGGDATFPLLPKTRKPRKPKKPGRR